MYDFTYITIYEQGKQSMVVKIRTLVTKGID